jgi:hypothetical protein
MQEWEWKNDKTGGYKIRKMSWLAIALSVLLAMSCNTKDEKKTQGSTEVAIMDTSSTMSIQGNTAANNNAETTYVSRPAETTYRLQSDERRELYSGVFYNTTINDDNVNVCADPTTKAKVLFKLNKDAEIQIIGVSKERDIIDNYEGNWCEIRLADSWEEGWVFSKYVDSETIEPNDIHITGMLVPEEQRAQGIAGTYKIADTEYSFIVYPHKVEHQRFYTFGWDIDNEKFHYSNIPGTYVWYSETKELKHITYTSVERMSAWVIFTDDFKYELRDYGTAPGPRGLGVYRTDDGSTVFSGYYLDDVNMRGHVINVVYPFYSWDDVDDEIQKYADDFKQQNPEPEDMIEYSREVGLGLTFIVNCEIDLDTGIRKILGGEYIYTQ